MAKLGVLWANGGTWDGRRVLAEGWAEMSTQVQAGSGGTEAYGVGWWVASDRDGGYRAVGRGGQLLLVMPERGLVIAALGSGASAQAVVDRVLPALISEDRALLSDDLGQQRLAAVTSSVREAPEPDTPGGRTSTIAMVSGTTWVFDDGPIGVGTIRLDFKGKDREGVVRMTFAGEPVVERLPIGLDGTYRIDLDRHRRPVAVRGEWVSGRTFVMDMDEIADGRALTLRMTFAKDGASVAVECQEAGEEGSLSVEGHADDE